MKRLTEKSVKNYQKVLKNIIDISLLEIFLEIGIELIELYPEEMYIHFLVEMMQEKHLLDSPEEVNMKFRQLQDFYNDVIATYDDDNMFTGDIKEPLAIEEVVMTLISFQSDEQIYAILLNILTNAVETVADEYGFFDALYEMEDEALKSHLEKEVFLGIEALYVNFISLFDMRNSLRQMEEYDGQVLYVTATMTTVNLSVFNEIRKKRFMIEQKRAKMKVKRNDPCPCGSGKKYKKCCLQAKGRDD